MPRVTPARHLILIELNEVNFDVASRYVDQLDLKNFRRILSLGVRRTSSEQRYEQLEPWIQWVSAHSGLEAEEHGIFRLGDIVKSGVPQFFEKVEAAGYRVGAVSPMNTENRLHSPAYFIPDPWTHTPTDGSFWSRHLWLALSQAVNDNSSGRITAASAARLALAFARFARPRHYGLYLKLLRRAKGAPWRKALVLDLFLHDLHMHLYQRHRPNFSTLFLNAGAHIQHHYFFNSRHAPNEKQLNPSWYIGAEDDPIAEMLQVYDSVLGEYLEMANISFLVATGLTQTPYDRIKYYYRLSNHYAFLSQIGLKFAHVLPRMTRDFVIEFDSVAEASRAQSQLASLKVANDGIALFGEIDNRGTSLFVALTYPKEIGAGTQVVGGPCSIELLPHVAFVAIKNGMHAAHGYVVGTGEVLRDVPADGEHVKGLYRTVLRYFGLQPHAVASEQQVLASTTVLAEPVS